MNIECKKDYAAYHEAGHLVIAYNYGEAEEAELLDTGENCGRTKYKHNLIDIETSICAKILLAGPIAELRYRRYCKRENSSIDHTKSNDYYQAQKKLGRNPVFDDEEEYREKLRPYEKSVKVEVEKAWGAIIKVAEWLNDNGKITRQELVELGI